MLSVHLVVPRNRGDPNIAICDVLKRAVGGNPRPQMRGCIGVSPGQPHGLVHVRHEPRPVRRTHRCVQIDFDTLAETVVDSEVELRELYEGSGFEDPRDAFDEELVVFYLRNVEWGTGGQ